MIRTLFAGILALGLGICVAHAEEVKGTVKSVDASTNSITLTVEGKDQSFAVSKDASFVSVNLGKNKKGKPVETVATIENGLAGIMNGAKVTVLTESEGGKDVVMSVKVSTGAAVKKAGNKNKKKKPKKKKNT